MSKRGRWWCHKKQLCGFTHTPLWWRHLAPFLWYPPPNPNLLRGNVLGVSLVPVEAHESISRRVDDCAVRFSVKFSTTKNFTSWIPSNKHKIERIFTVKLLAKASIRTEIGTSPRHSENSRCWPNSPEQTHTSANFPHEGNQQCYSSGVLQIYGDPTVTISKSHQGGNWTLLGQKHHPLNFLGWDFCHIHPEGKKSSQIDKVVKWNSIAHGNCVRKKGR